MPNNEQNCLLLLNLHWHEQERKKKSPSQKKREKKRRKEWIKQKEDSKKSLTTDDSEASDKWESPPILPGNTDTQMVDDINSYSVSISTTNEGEASDKSESSLIPGNADTEMVDNTTSESEYLTIHQMLENRCYARLRNRLDESLESYWRNPMRRAMHLNMRNALKYVNEN